jgi:hypothetical protein
MGKGKSNLLVILFVCISIISCSHITGIDGYIESTNDNIVDLQKFTDRKIDFIYIFGEYTDNKDISAIIGCKYEGDIIQDSQYLLLLVSNKEVIYKENFNEKNFEFSRNKENEYQGIIYRKYNSSRFKIKRTPSDFKKLLPIIPARPSIR